MIERLTDRERQILELASQHLTSKQIGPMLGIRPASVDTFMQTIIKKLGVAGRKEAVIAYLAARQAKGQDRDDLDFGSSPMARRGQSGRTGGVTRDGHQDLTPPFGEPLGSTGPNRSPGLVQAVRLNATHVLTSGVSSPVRRLVAVAIVAMVLGLVTLGAVAVGYGLNQTFDRMLGDHGIQPAAGKAE